MLKFVKYFLLLCLICIARNNNNNINKIRIYLPTDNLELIQHEIQIKILNKVEYFELIVNRLNVIIE